jgi:hypothetical protein
MLRRIAVPVIRQVRIMIQHKACSPFILFTGTGFLPGSKAMIPPAGRAFNRKTRAYGQLKSPLSVNNLKGLKNSKNQETRYK